MDIAFDVFVEFGMQAALEAGDKVLAIFLCARLHLAWYSWRLPLESSEQQRLKTLLQTKRSRQCGVFRKEAARNGACDADFSKNLNFCPPVPS